MAYGATGSGKTHTCAELLPLISRSLFGAIGAQGGRDVAVHVTALEVYNERVRWGGAALADCTRPAPRPPMRTRPPGAC